MDIISYKKRVLDSLYAPYKKCTMCPLSTMGRTHVVFGDGNPDANLLLIGEGPGRDEDAQGFPFIGRSGKLLTKTLDALNIRRSDLYITNIVKCRPPHNRTPLPNEISVCTNTFLNKQIKIIQPRIICTLGSCSTKAITNNFSGITKIRGTMFSYENIPVLPTFHPAYILRNPSAFSYMAQDLNTAYLKSKSSP